ncbi:MAG: hypothetical protein HYW86_00740 [Candidatus Roizmanbacteria bacterium]|nr:MAG: hypothetical protein HYW86_00740 [Candidatus Roizmanbacteria bacterium]
MLLKNKIVLITGASSGIYKATALFFAKEGVTICFKVRLLYCGFITLLLSPFNYSSILCNIYVRIRH